MKLTYLVPTSDKVFYSTLGSFKDDAIPVDWRDWLYSFFPSLDKEKSLSLSWKERKKYVQSELEKIYHSVLPILQQKATQWNTFFQKRLPELTILFSNVFNLDASCVFNDMSAYVNLNPICPRYLDEHSFYLFYNYSDEFVFTVSLHELIHFFWFYKWQEYFHDNPAEYDEPHLKWIYSEMVEDTFAHYSDFKKFFSQQNAHNYFYKLTIDGENLLEILGKIYSEQGLNGLFTSGFDMIRQNEKQIRTDIRKITGSNWC